jgi:hypothetical protein
MRQKVVEKLYLRGQGLNARRNQGTRPEGYKELREGTERRSDMAHRQIIEAGHFVVSVKVKRIQVFYVWFDSRLKALALATA